MTKETLERLAEACESAAEYFGALAVLELRFGRLEDSALVKDPGDAAARLKSLVRAIRAGRVTVTEETNG